MIGVVYLGSNPKTEERLKYIPGRLVQYTRNYKDAASACSTHVRNEHFIVFFEQGEQSEDINAITYLKKKNKHVYIILLTNELDPESRIQYQKSGINDTLDSPIARICCLMISNPNTECCVSKFPFGNASLMYSSPFSRLSSPLLYSFLLPLPSVWRAKARLSSSQSELVLTTPSLIS